MKNPNIGWLYYVDYFREENPLRPMDFHFLLPGHEKKKEVVESLLKGKCQFLSLRSFKDYEDMHYTLENAQHFSLTTTYPGLLVGTGYEHELHIENEFKLGFFFDYTSGLPVIPGSSIKGVLRSAFKIPELMNELLPGKNVRAIELEIFNGVDIEKTKLEDYPEEKKQNWKYLPSPQKDVFYDAIITDSKNENGKFLAADFITPHKHKSERKLDQFANPVPLQFMKVLPEVEFLFQFDLKDSRKGGLKSTEKKDLFEKIIRYLGIGAKTRTGYGWMK